MWTVLLAVFLFPGTAAAAVGDANPAGAAARPKIGLVLGGGGARGAAHIGVLKVLEEMHIPIDYVAGNSMGAIIGGLYASGYSPEEIERELNGIDWTDVFDDAPARPDRSFRRKRDDDLYAVKSRLGYSDGKFKFPLAVVQGQKLDLELRRLTLRVANIHDFNKLPIPFRAVATDIETGQAVVLESGDLGKAIRASMAVPGAFDPVEIDGKLLVDGLVANNVPVDVARAMGADVVIVVDVGSGLLKREQLTTAFSLVGQLANILSTRNVEAQLATLKPGDILIRPDLGNLSGADFTKANAAIAKGDAAARASSEALARLSVSADSYGQFLGRVETQSGAPVVAFVRLENPTRIGDDAILSKITLKPGQPLDTDQLDRDIGVIYGMDVFETVSYRVVEEDGKSGIVLSAKEKSWGPNYLQFGVRLSDNFHGDSAYDLGVLYTRTAINRLNGELRFALQIGQQGSVAAEWYQPIDPASRYFFNVGGGANRSIYKVYNGDNIISQYDVSRFEVNVAAGREFGTWGEGRVGYRVAYGKADLQVGEPTYSDTAFHLGEVYGRLATDTLDDVYFPKRGNRGQLELDAAREALGSDSDYSQGSLSYLHAFSWGRNNLVGRFRFNTTFGDDAPVQSLFRMGGFFNLSGYNMNQLSGQDSGLLGVAFYRRVYDLKPLAVYLGGTLEYGNVWQAKRDISVHNALANGSAYFGADTPIGPLYVGVGFGQGGQRTGFLYLGSPY